MALSLLLNLVGEVLGQSPWSVAKQRQGKCDGSPLDEYQNYTLLGNTTMPVNKRNIAYRYVQPFVNRKVAEVTPRLNKLESDSNERITKMYDDERKKFEDANQRKIDKEYEEKYKKLEEQYNEYLKKLEEEYEKTKGEQQDRFTKNEDSKIEREKAKKQAFDDAVIKNVENRSKFEASKKKVPGCEITEQSEAKIRHDAFLEEKNRQEDAENYVEGSGKKRNKRADVVKEIMVKKGLSMIEASKYVKQHNLY